MSDRCLMCDRELVAVLPEHRAAVRAALMCRCTFERFCATMGAAELGPVPWREGAEVLAACGWATAPGPTRLPDATDTPEDVRMEDAGRWAARWASAVLLAWTRAGLSFTTANRVNARLAEVLRRGRMEPEWVAAGEAVLDLGGYETWIEFLRGDRGDGGA